MEAWMTFWRIVLYAGIGLFAAMSVYVILWGFRDIQVMLRELSDQTGSDSQADSDKRAGSDDRAGPDQADSDNRVE